MGKLNLFARWSLVASVIVVPADLFADDVTIEALQKTVPILSPQNKDLVSFQCVVTIPAMKSAKPAYLTVKLGWTGPDNYGCLFIDQSTNVPFAFSANNNLMMYDAASATLLIDEGQGPDFGLKVAKEKISIKFGFAPKTKDFYVDLPSLLYNTQPDHVLKQLDDDRWQTTSTTKSGSNHVITTFDRSRPWPIESMEVREINSGRIYISVTEIKINEPLDKQLQEFPTADRFPPELNVRELSNEGRKGLVENYQIGKIWMTTLIGRFGLDDESMRKNPLLRNVNWDAALRTDALVGPAMRSIFNIPDDPSSEEVENE